MAGFPCLRWFRHAGSLFECLRAVAERTKLNMKKLASRPIPGKPGQYMFYVRVEGRSERTRSESLVTLSRKAIDSTDLGQYRGIEKRRADRGRRAAVVGSAPLRDRGVYAQLLQLLSSSLRAASYHGSFWFVFTRSP
jgi:hypothetical protein